MRTRSQRLLSMVLALSMLLTFLPVSAFAEGTPPPYSDSQTLDKNDTSNTYTDSSNNKYQYTLNTDGTATLTKFTGKHANVPEKVTKGDDTYTVTTIGKYAFATLNDRYQNPVYNTDLESVILPGSIQTIERYAFIDCTKLSSLTTWNQDTSIPNGITTIAEQTFDSCTSLGNFTFPNTITSIESGAFSLCTSLSNVTLPKDLVQVQDGAFHGANLETIDWPVSLTIVGDSAFQNEIDYTSNPPSIKVSIKTITYHGTQAQWDEMKNDRNFATTNFQLVAKDVDLRCAHTVTFNANGHGTAPDAQVVQYGEKAEKPLNDPKAESYKFMGWFTTPDGDETFDFNTGITKDETAYAHWEKDEKPAPTPENPGTQEKPTEPNPPQKPDNNKTDTDKPNKPNDPTPPEVPAVEEDDTAAIGYAAAAVTAAFVGWGAYRIGSEVYLKYLLPKDALLPQNRIQLAKLLWEDAGRPAPADAAAYTDVDANDTDARQAARWAVENGLLTLPNAEKPEEFAPYRSVSYAKSARAWNKAQQLKENAAR